MTVVGAAESVSVDAFRVLNDCEVEEMKLISQRLLLADKEMKRKRDLRNMLNYKEDTAWLEDNRDASLQELEERAKIVG